ncbi:MAG: glycosyltransferase family 4 protein [Saprospiraceae bacterium]|nr:glycosyltransferase family 4 protein [Saprospiraceae bacterium]
MSKKLIYILNHYSNNSDQHFFHVINLLEAIADLGVEVALVIEKCEAKPVVNSGIIKVYGIPLNVSKWRRPICLFNILRKLYSKGYTKVFTRISKAGIIVPILFSFLYRKTETYYWHSGTVFEFNRKTKSRYALLRDDIEFWFIKTFVTCFVTGPEAMKTYYSDVAGVKEDKIVILYNDIDLLRFNVNKGEDLERAKKMLNLGLPKDAKIILFVHRLSPIRESLFYLPYVLDKFYESEGKQNFYSIIIGGGSDKIKLEKLLTKSTHKDKIKILGSMPNAVIQDYYSIADIFINPTMAEGFPRVILEAEAMGLPIVSTDAGGIRDIMPLEQQPYIVAKTDRDSFAKALIDLAARPEERVRLGGINRAFVEKYATPNVASMYVDKLFNA